MGILRAVYTNLPGLWILDSKFWFLIGGAITVAFDAFYLHKFWVFLRSKSTDATLKKLFIVAKYGSVAIGFEILTTLTVIVSFLLFPKGENSVTCDIVIVALLWFITLTMNIMKFKLDEKKDSTEETSNYYFSESKSKLSETRK